MFGTTLAVSGPFTNRQLLLPIKGRFIIFYCMVYMIRPIDPDRKFLDVRLSSKLTDLELGFILVSDCLLVLFA